MIRAHYVGGCMDGFMEVVRSTDSFVDLPRGDPRHRYRRCGTYVMSDGEERVVMVLVGSAFTVIDDRRPPTYPSGLLRASCL